MENQPLPVRATVTPVSPVPQRKTSPILIILLILVFLVSVATAAFLYIQNMSLKSQLIQLTATPTPEVTPEVTATPATDSALVTPEATPSASGYICPATGWVDCMPILDEAGQKRCGPEALTWYKANCPNFQGSAL